MRRPIRSSQLLFPRELCRKQHDESSIKHRVIALSRAVVKVSLDDVNPKTSRKIQKYGAEARQGFQRVVSYVVCLLILRGSNLRLNDSQICLARSTQFVV